ncbi:MAG: hypothetical protein K0R24_173 [Gammaproteobacteria bacterium]|nr:hypothetical protein [Gammaproteobacteria bacterium]
MSKFAIITGASRGIGECVAHYFASQGYDLALIARNEEALSKTKAAINADFPAIKITTHALDISDAKNTYDQIKACIHAAGKIDVIFNSAGISINGTSTLSIDDFQKLQLINVSGMFAVAKAAAEMMKEQGSGYIFNVASMSGKRALVRNGGYASTKFAVVGFSEALFKELMPYGVKVTVLCPSVVNTEMTRHFDMPLEHKIEVQDIVKTVDYLLSLSSAAVIPSIDIHCKAIVEKGP